jgi:hypothetical protein
LWRARGMAAPDVSYGRVQSEPCRRAGGRLEENLAAIVAPIASRRRHTGGGPSSAPATRSWIYSRSRRHSTIHYGQPRRNTESVKRHKPPDPVSTKRGQAHWPICWTKFNLSVTLLPSADACTFYMLSYLDRDTSVICSALSGRQRRLLERARLGNSRTIVIKQP